MSRKGLMEQDLSKLDVTTLHPLSPEVISRQATINIGTIGHVAHGKSTVVKAISGVQTVRFKNELERNITIKLGYANAKIYKCEDDRCPRPMCYKAYGSGKEDAPMCDVPGFENARMKLLRHVSFVDCPGHDILMATMLNGAAIMDGALLLIAANESCPQPQTSEHLAAIEIMRLQHIIILQNKVDLIQENVAINQHEAIQKFIQGTVADNAPVIPVSAQLKYNIDAVCEYIVKKIPIPERNFISPPNMIVIRSFDVNKPGSEVDDIRGGVAGGSILKGVLRVNQNIEVRPGIVVKDESGNIKCTPIYSRIVSLYAEQNELQFAVPGGLIGVGTTMDPTLTRADRLVGQVLGEVGSLPEVYVELEVNFFLLRRLLGVRTKGTERQGKVAKLTKAEILMLNIGSMSTGARVVAVKNDLAKLQLTSPVCTSKAVEAQILARIRGTVKCAVTVTTPQAPAFPNARAQLRCGTAVISSSITNSLGSFRMQLKNPTAVLLNLLSTNCTIAVRTPLAQCNSSLPSAGTLIAPLQSSLPTIDGSNIVLNLIAGIFKSPAFVLATAAVVFLAIAHIVINVATGCLCVRILPEVLNFRLTTALVSSTMSWFTLSAAVFLLISGAALSYKDGEESTYEGNYYCFVINRRIFALGGLLSLATVFLGILAHILVFSADDLDERWAPPAAPGLHGIAMGQAELSPQSSGDQEFVQEIIAYRGQEMV
ncbi:hypothetical protein ACET3Z_002206 [Daucus carota]